MAQKAVKIFKIVLVLVALVGTMVNARPSFNSRVKRVSDTHLQDLETKLALTKLKGFTITLPVAAGKDLDRIGRKRRSQSRALDVLFNQSEESANSNQQMNELFNDFRPINDFQSAKNKRFNRLQAKLNEINNFQPISERLDSNGPMSRLFFNNDYDEDPLNYELQINK